MKNGNSAIILQPRDRMLLERIAFLRLLTRDQIQLLAGFHSVSRVNVRLGKLRRAGLILRYYMASSSGSRRSVYALTRSGALEIHSSPTLTKWRPDSALLGNSFATHQLALNDLYIAAVNSANIVWGAFQLPPIQSIPIIPDGCIQTEHQMLFVEMDLGTESLNIWSRKVDLYLKLAVTGAHRQIAPYPHFGVLVVAIHEDRLKSIRRQVAKQTQKLFWFQTLSIIQRQGFWATSWLRTTGETLSLPGA